MLGINTIKISPALLVRLCDVDEFKGLWAGLDRHTTGLNMLREVADHSSELHRVLKSLQDFPLTTDLIQKIHQAQTRSKEPVSYKSRANQLGFLNADDVPIGFLETAEPIQVKPLMDKLCGWTQDSLTRDDFHPLLVIAVFMAVFLQVSPFEDQNLETAMFVALLLLMKTGYAYAPYVPLDKVFPEHASEIFCGLKHNQASLESGSPDWGEWLSQFLALLQAQKNILLERLDEKEKDLSHLPTLSARILSLFEDHERLQMKEIIKLTNGRRSTIKLRIGELVEQGYLKRHGQARNTWYALN